MKPSFFMMKDENVKAQRENVTDLERVLLAVPLGSLRDDCPADPAGRSQFHGCVSYLTPLAKQLSGSAERGAGGGGLTEAAALTGAARECFLQRQNASLFCGRNHHP